LSKRHDFGETNQVDQKEKFNYLGRTQDCGASECEASECEGKKDETSECGAVNGEALSMFWEAVEARTPSAKPTPDHVRLDDRTAFSFADFTGELSLARYLPYAASMV